MASDDVPVGIDLGTTNSLVGAVIEGKAKLFADASGAAVIPAGDVRAVLHTANQVVAADAESVVTIGGESPNTLGDGEH